MKEIRTKLDVYIPLLDEKGQEISKDEAYNLITQALKDFSFQVYEQEIETN